MLVSKGVVSGNRYLPVQIGPIFRTTSDLSDKVSLDLKKRGMQFVGSTTIYSYLLAVGVIDDHEMDCDWPK